MSALALVYPGLVDAVEPSGDAGDITPGVDPAVAALEEGFGDRRVVGTASHPARTVAYPALPTLEATLLALMRGELRECLVCGEPVEGDGERVECPACGSVLDERPAEVAPGQLTLLDG